jgi:hypothetical protein
LLKAFSKIPLNGFITAIEEDKRELWFASNGTGIAIFNPKKSNLRC